MWTLSVTIRRWRAQWRLLLAVTAVAVLACTLVTSLGLLVSATERAGVQGALDGIPAQQAEIDVRVQHPTSPIADVRGSVAGAVDTLLGDTASVRESGFATSDVIPIDTDTFVYFGEYDGFNARVELVDGVFPTTSAASGIDVAVPEAAATALHLAPGDSFAVQVPDGDVTARIVGVYRPIDPDDEYWSHDLLGGVGDDPAFGRPGVSYSPPVEAIGPLVSAPGAVDAVGVPIESIDVAYRPAFADATVDELQPLAARLADADVEIPASAGSVGASTFVSTRLGDAVESIGAGLVVTRSTVVVIALLLGILAVAAMSQTARLFTDARAGERRLLRARGAAARHLLALGVVEAAAIGLVAAVLAPVLATLVYAALARQPPMVAAGMPATVAASPATWASAAGVGTLLVLVLIAPLVLRAGELVDAERARPRRLGGIARSGLDLGLVVIAAVAFWQLRAYRSPVAASGSLAIDPVLVAGPAIALLACALVCVRLIPLAARALERIGEGGRGALGALVGWEIGRRTRRATTTVLALSLALAVGTFALSFLATWKQSQLDQAGIAVGAPARSAVDASAPFGQAGELARGALGEPQPVIHRLTRVIAPDTPRGDAAGGVPAQVLGLSAGARSMLDSGRAASEGGDVIARAIPVAADAAGIDLGDGVTDIGATVSIVAPKLAAGRVTASLTAIVAGPSGLLGTVDLGEVAVDGAPHSVSAPLAPALSDGTAAPAASGALALEGIRVTVAGTSVDESRTDDAAVRVTVSAVGAGRGGSVTPIAVGSAPGWSPVAVGEGVSPPIERPGLAFDATVPAGITGSAAVFELLAWEPVRGVVAVLPAEFATAYALTNGARASILVQGIEVPLAITRQAPLVPGSIPIDELTGATSSVGAPANAAVVVDATALSRILVQEGFSGVAADEWWIDVAPGAGVSYAAGHPGVVSGEAIGLQLQQAPLRVATQAALWLAILSGGILAAVGFAVQTAATVRERRLEFAQLQAVGLARRGLTTIVALESALLVALGAVFGVAIGLGLAFFVGPLVAVSPSGVPPVPAVIVEVPALGIVALVGVTAVVLVGVVLGVASVYRAARPADLLRAGGD